MFRERFAFEDGGSPRMRRVGCDLQATAYNPSTCGGDPGMSDARVSTMRSAYPVHYTIVAPARFTRMQLLLRLLVFCVLGMLGLSFGLAFAVGFVALPVFAALRLSARGATPSAYVGEDGPKVVALLRWFAAISAWAGLIAEEMPRHAPEETVRIEVEPDAHPTPGSALSRLLSGVPSALVLAFLCWIGAFVWIWAALSILIRERVGAGAFTYLVGLQRWSIRLLAYQASLVDEYPPFSFTENLRDSPPTANALG